MVNLILLSSNYDTNLIFYSIVQKSFDLILMDNYMPVMNGIEACKAIRALGDLSIIIGLTGHTLEADKLLFLESGANQLLVKPIATAKLKHILINDI